MLKEYEAAIIDLSDAINLNSKDIPLEDLFYHRGFTYFKLEKYAAAISDFNKSIEINKSYAEAYYLRGYSKSMLKEYEAAILDLSDGKGLNSDIDKDFYLLRGISYFNLKKYDLALIDLDKYPTKNLNYGQVCHYKYLIYKSQKNYTACLENLQLLKQIDTTNIYKVDSDIGLTLIKLKRYSEAKEHYEAFLLNEPENSIALNN